MKTESAGDMLGRIGTDARAWTTEFTRRIGGVDEGTMLAWFAGAIEAGRTAGRQETCPHPGVRLFVYEDLRLCGVCGKNLDETRSYRDETEAERRARRMPHPETEAADEVARSLAWDDTPDEDAAR